MGVKSTNIAGCIMAFTTLPIIENLSAEVEQEWGGLATPSCSNFCGLSWLLLSFTHSLRLSAQAVAAGGTVALSGDFIGKFYGPRYPIQ